MCINICIFILEVHEKLLDNSSPHTPRQTQTAVTPTTTTTTTQRTLTHNTTNTWQQARPTAAAPRPARRRRRRQDHHTHAGLKQLFIFTSTYLTLMFDLGICGHYCVIMFHHLDEYRKNES